MHVRPAAAKRSVPALHRDVVVHRSDSWRPPRRVLRLVRFGPRSNLASQARETSRLYNASTLVTLMAGVLICYVALYVVNLAWAYFVLDPDVMGSHVHAPLGYGPLFILAWFVASAATVGGGLGSGLSTDETI